MELSIGIGKKERSEIAEDLSCFLADTYALYLKTQNFHWNLEGPSFISLHLLFQKQYEEMAEAVDEIAERIRALGHYAEGSFSSFLKKTQIQEGKKDFDYKKMILQLSEDHSWIAATYRAFIPKFQKLKDEVSADMMIKRLAFHEKEAWLLRSHLD